MDKRAVLEIPTSGLVGPRRHSKVADSVVERVLARVWQGMGSSHCTVAYSKHYAANGHKLLQLSAARAGERATLGLQPGASNRARMIAISNRERRMYGEPFAVRRPTRLFSSLVRGRRGFPFWCTWKRGNGKTLLRPGHEAYPIYYNQTSGWFLRNAFAGPQAMAQNGSTVARKSPPKNAPEPLEIKGPKIHKEDEAGFR